MWNLKVLSKCMFITKQKQTYKYRKQTSGNQWGEGKGEGKDKGMGLRDTNYYV